MKRILFVPIADPTAPHLRNLMIGVGAGVTLGLNLYLAFGRWWEWLAVRL